MTLTIRPADFDDAPAMTAILNDIIAIGGSTAHQRPFDTDRMKSHYIAPAELICCHVAELDGKIVGFQSLDWAHDHNDMPKGWAVIASFVAGTAAGQGVGKQIFAATRRAAQAAGVQVIDATIRADNTAGLKYYSGLGFTDYAVLRDVPLRDGTSVDRIRKSLTP